LRVQKKHVAENVLRSWLRAVGIGCDPAAGGISVAGALISVVPDPRDELLDNTISLLADVTSSDLSEALEAFHAVTTATGNGMPVPVDRGPAPTHAEVYGQDLFLVASRHREFRNSPDLPANKVLEYKPVVVRWARSFFMQNRELCQGHGYEVGDLVTFGWMWAHVYAHKSEIVTKGDDNKKLLTRCLQQRGSELHRYLKKKARDTFPDRQTAYFVMTGEPLSSAKVIEIDTAPSEQPKAAVVVRSRKEAADTLESRLAALPHDRMVEALTEASVSFNRDYATQQTAAKMLKKHVGSCTCCQSRPFPVQERGEEHVGGAYTTSYAEAVEDALG
jgi:hypothetical protein